MADSKITGLTADTAPTGDDLVVSVNDPLGTPANRKVKVSDLMNQALMQNPYKFSVYRNAALTTASATFTALPFDTKSFDTGTNVDVVTNKGRFTVPVTGFYMFNGRFDATDNRSIIGLYKNGTEVARGVDLQVSGGINGVSVSALLQLTAADYVEVYYYTSAAVALSTGVAQAYFNGFLVSIT